CLEPEPCRSRPFWRNRGGQWMDSPVMNTGEYHLILASKQAGLRGFVAESSPRAGFPRQLYPIVTEAICWSRSVPSAATRLVAPSGMGKASSQSDFHALSEETAHPPGNIPVERVVRLRDALPLGGTRLAPEASAY